ncbi:MAG: FliI/YscN family ATPase [Fibrobacteria bacterium]|nr:FliI/YscN family ATPase [Fibrobacteria bacterium]
MDSGLSSYREALEKVSPLRVKGKVTKVIGLIIESAGPVASMGELCEVYQNSTYIGMAEVVGFRDSSTLLMALTAMDKMRPGMDVVATKRPFSAQVSEGLLGRVISGLGEPLDGKGPLASGSEVDLHQSPPNPMERQRIADVMVTGIRAIDGFRTMGKGQRLGIFSGSGVGKSVLMGMIARNCKADINVVALIGERGRELKEFIEKDLGEEGLKRSIVVVATADTPAIVRVKAAFLATAIAEHFRDQGKDVMLMMDSSTRIALAQREIGLAAGEPPTTRGFPPSVFSMLPRLFERAGMGKCGSITALYTVLVEGDDLDEPISDAVRSVLDGHIVLSRDLANRNHYPAIQVLQSVSRCFTDVVTDKQKEAVGQLLKYMAIYADSEDMIQLGAYVKGTNADLDQAVELNPLVEKFLMQQIEETTDFDEALNQLSDIKGHIP